jgi:hypothetical protein
LVAVEGDLVNFGSESVGVVPQGVLDLTEDLFGWRVGEYLGHPACPLLQERAEAVHQLPDAGLTVVAGCGHGAVGVGHDVFTEGDLLRRHESGRRLTGLHLHSPDSSASVIWLLRCVGFRTIERDRQIPPVSD